MISAGKNTATAVADALPILPVVVVQDTRIVRTRRSGVLDCLMLVATSTVTRHALIKKTPSQQKQQTDNHHPFTHALTTLSSMKMAHYWKQNATQTQTDETEFLEAQMDGKMGKGGSRGIKSCTTILLLLLTSFSSSSALGFGLS